MKIVKKDIFFKYPKKLHDLHSYLPILPKRIKVDKCKKLVCDLHNKKKYVVHIKSLIKLTYKSIKSWIKTNKSS